MNKLKNELIHKDKLMRWKKELAHSRGRIIYTVALLTGLFGIMVFVGIDIVNGIDYIVTLVLYILGLASSIGAYTLSCFLADEIKCYKEIKNFVEYLEDTHDIVNEENDNE